MTQNQINYHRHLEDVRSHQATERETNRANLARESEQHRSNTVNEQLTASRDAETMRSNQAREAETNRSNLAREMETNRSNLAQESLKSEQIRTESEDRRYASENALAGTMYSADQSYQGRVDSAYINKHGVAPTTIAKVAKGTAGLANEAIRSPVGQKVARMTIGGVQLMRVAATAAVAQTFSALAKSSLPPATTTKNKVKERK